MTRTFIFDSADPSHSNFIDDASAYSSEDHIDEDFLSFEDDLHTDGSSDDSDASGVSNNPLTRFRSRTRSSSTSSDGSDDSGSDDGEGRPQRFVRAFSRAVGGGRSRAGSASRRAGSSTSLPEAVTGTALNFEKHRRRRRKKEVAPGNASLEDVREDESSPVRIINEQELDTIPFPGVLNNGSITHTNGVAFNDDSKDEENSSLRSGIRNRKASSNTMDSLHPNDIASSTSISSHSVPTTHLNRTGSQKRSRRRYSGSMGSAAAAQRRAGWEPGVDIRTTDIILQSIGSAVTIVDYSVDRYRIVQTEVYPAPKTDESPGDPSLVVNKEFHEHLNTRPSWSQVRWISVNGLSWEAISAISKKYQLHRLAIEDMVDIPQRTKVDLYPTHTFCCLPLHKLIAFKPQSKSEYSFFDSVFGKSKKPTKKKSSSKLNPVKSNSSTKSKSEKTKVKREETDSSKSSGSPPTIEITPPHTINPTHISLDNGRRRPMPIGKTRNLPTNGSDSSSSSSSDEDEEDAHKPLNSILAATGMDTIYEWNNPYAALQQKSSYIESKRPLSVYKRAVGVEQVSLFLTNQSTVISFFERSATDIERPLLARLSTQSTILRESCDPSLLLQAIVDAIVDLIQPIIAAYRRRMDELEIDAMLNPSMSHTQDLHLMAGELSMLRNTMVPITSLVLSLRDHNSSHLPENVNGSATGNTMGKIPIISQGSTGLPVSGGANEPVIKVTQMINNNSGSANSSSSSISQTQDPLIGNRISALAKVYLADISDHLLSHTQDLDVMRNNVKNMIDLIFNTISIQSSDSVGQLTLVTVIFLPLSFWTGYFGMNFQDFHVLDNSPSYYWYIAVPFSAGVLVLAMLSWIRNAFVRGRTAIRKKIRMHQRKVKKQKRKKAKKKEVVNHN